MQRQVNLLLHKVRPKIIVEEVGSIANKMNDTNSYVCIQVGSNKIYLASSRYIKKSQQAKISNFYQEKNIEENIDLTKIIQIHGSIEDTKELNMPNFVTAAQKIQEGLNKHSSVLVNCNNGRSRTGTAVALYLMVYEKLSADKAIEVVNTALAERGVEKGIDIKLCTVDGSYGQWLRDFEIEQFNKENEMPNFFIRFKRKKPNPPSEYSQLEKNESLTL